MISEVLMLLGAILILFSALGVNRFTDVMAQMHFLSKATSLGVFVLLIGAAIGMDHVNDWTSLVLAAVLLMMTSPVSANLISRSTYLRERRELGADNCAPIETVRWISPVKRIKRETRR